ncbi:serine hydrolase [Vagococcus sp. JNUCC 83]
MKKINRYLVHIVISLISIIFIFPLTNYAEEADFTIPARAAIAVDFDTGKILYEKNSTSSLPIASMTKLLSAYLVYEAVEDGKVNWKDSVPFDDALIKLTDDPNLSNIPIHKNQTYTVEDNLKAMLISSSNVSTTALARFISGSEQKFVDEMNQKVKDWGIKDAQFISASGLDTQDLLKEDRYPESKDEDSNIMSAKDMVIVARHLIADYPQVLEITKEPHFTLFAGTDKEETFWSSNLMLPEMYYYTKGVDGLKTGTTPNAGACFIGSTVQNNHRIITVVMNVDENYNRFEVTKNLLNYVNDTWEYQAVNKQHNPSVVAKVNVNKGKTETVPLIIKDDAYLWVNKQQSDLKQLYISNSETLSAPLKQREVVGKQVTTDTNDSLGYLEKTDSNKATSKVITKNNVEKANIFVRVWRSIKNSIK